MTAQTDEVKASNRKKFTRLYVGIIGGVNVALGLDALNAEKFNVTRFGPLVTAGTLSFKFSVATLFTAGCLCLYYSIPPAKRKWLSVMRSQKTQQMTPSE